MNMDKRIIGEKAGIIWRTLHNNICRGKSY